MHDRDLPGRAAEGERRDAQPDPEGLAERHAVAGLRRISRLLHNLIQAVSPSSSDARRWSARPACRRGRAACRPWWATIPWREPQTGTFAGFGDRPVVRLVGGVAAPAVEGVVERHAGLELLEVVGIHARQPERGGEQAGRFRREVEPGRVGAAHDRREAQQRLGAEAELLDHDVEGAALAAVAPEHALDVEGRRREALGDGLDLGRRDEQEHRVRIDEAADQPRAGDAVDLRPRARHPDRAALAVARRQLVGWHQRQAGVRPGLEAALERPRPGRPAWRSQAATPWLSFCALLADDDGGLGRRTPAPTPMRSACGAADGAGISRGSASKSSSVRTSTMTGHFGVPIRRASFSTEMVLIDDMVRPRVVSGTRCFGMSPRGEIAFPMRGIECPEALVSSRLSGSTIGKPPGMRWRTFDLLLEKVEAAEGMIVGHAACW